MIMTYHNHTLQTNSKQGEEEPHNTNIHKTSEIEIKQTVHSLFLVKRIAKLERTHSKCITKQKPIQIPTNNVRHIKE